MVFKKAFTLIEVMVAVLIVSVVIAALLKMQGDTNYLFEKLEKVQNKSHYASFLLWNRTYGLDTSNTDLYRLVNLSDTFRIDDDARKILKNTKLTIDYKRLKTLDGDGVSFEIGRTRMKAKDFEIDFNRIIQP